MCIPQGECRPIPCRNPALRSGLRRGLGRTAHSAIGTHFGGSRGASAALDPGLRPFVRLPSLSLSLHCRWRAVLLAHSLTLMPTRAFHSDDAMLSVVHRQSTRATSAAERCSVLRTSRRCLSGDAGASSGAGSLMPHRHPFLGPGIGATVGITSQLAVPAATLRGASCQSARHAT